MSRKRKDSIWYFTNPCRPRVVATDQSSSQSKDEGTRDQLRQQDFKFAISNQRIFHDREIQSESSAKGRNAAFHQAARSSCRRRFFFDSFTEYMISSARRIISCTCSRGVRNVTAPMLKVTGQ